MEFANRKPLKATVIGGGSFGTCMAQLLGRQGILVNMWVREPTVVEKIKATGENSFYLPGCPLSPNIIPTVSLTEALENSELVLLVIPTPFIRSFVIAHREYFATGVPILCCSKGIEKDTLDTPYEILRDELPGKFTKYLGCISGPSFAKEVALGMPTSVTCASENPAVSSYVQKAMSDLNFRVYITNDIIGSELSGAVKNVLAIASGALDGFGFGNNARAALITRGLFELRRLVVAKGGSENGILGLAGVGDLVLTCTSSLSRNYSTGARLAKGETIEQIKESNRTVAEGVFSALSIHQLAEKLKVEMPICEQVYRVIYENVPIQEALSVLQQRPLRSEIE